MQFKAPEPEREKAVRELQEMGFDADRLSEDRVQLKRRGAGGARKTIDPLRVMRSIEPVHGGRIPLRELPRSSGYAAILSKRGSD